MTDLVERSARAACDFDPPCSGHLRQARAIMAMLCEAGLVIVPREPSEKMLHAATMEVPTWDNDASRRKWRAMVAAAEKELG